MADGSKYLGARLQVTTTEGKYEGIVQSIDAERKKLTLNKVVCCSTGRRLHGFQHFFQHEINHLELLKEVKNNDQETKSKETEGEDGKETNKHSAARNTYSHKDSKLRRSRSAHTKSSVDFPRGSSTGAVKAFTNDRIGFNSKLAVSRGSLARDVSDEGSSLLKRDPIVAEKYLSDTVYDDADKENLSPDVLPDVVPIDAFGEAFEDAVKFISKQRVIGVCCEGVKLGRYGKLCWLVIGCSKAIYLFDVHTLGAPCFDEGLQDILESGDILKVFHDCRQASDALYHHYGITLMNVFDTQVADVLVYRNERGGDLPRHVNGLVACLYEYLDLSPEHVHFQKVRQKYMQRSDEIWAERPAPSSLLEASAKHVLYLRELRLAQMERLMAEFLYGVDIYLGEIRDSKELNPKARGQLLPDKFKELGRFRYRQRTRRYDGDFVENAKDVVPKDVLASREAWSEGRHFAEAYANKKGRVKERKFEHPTAVERLRQVARDSGSDSEASNASNTSNGVAHESGPVRMEQSSPPLPIPPHLPAGFSENDFPPLSSSESEGQGSPPRPPPAANANRKSRLQGAITERNIANTDAQTNNESSEPQRPGVFSRSAGEQSLPSQRPLGVFSKGFASPLGRGRARALLRHAAMPAVRLPTDNPDTVGDRRLFENDGNRGRESGHEFPSDDEILASPEIISLPRDHFVGGTQVRIRKT